ncbi:amidophosphoribosyltransferase [Thermotoga profunda]|uniref:amidophosphoribosyltransferase n=1 Tax=Thermotoga profunda TaxID=1508420 RepID=UPI000596E7E7|nr:amidophosphoribosyltransferase [Thermotoga profunda]
MPLKEACGLLGVFSSQYDESIAKTVYYGLFALQHRGQESAGIAVSDQNSIRYHKGLGLVSEVFNEEDLDLLGGKMAIGHVRYSTTGSNSLSNAQPLVVKYHSGELAVAHNGNIVNAYELRNELEQNGIMFHTTTDSEVVAALIAKSRKSLIDAIFECVEKVHGAYSLLIMSKDKLIAVRDSHGFRPLCIGSYNGSYVIASESAAFDTIGATFIRDVEPGEIVVFDEDGLKSFKKKSSKKSLCVFEFVYFARPDSTIDQVSVYQTRWEAGTILAREHPVDADLVVAVPDSGNVAAIGFSDASHIPMGMGLIKNRYIGRTFIQPSQRMRSLGVRLKLSPLRDLIKGKRIVLVDDSIVRGTTMGQIVRMLKDCGAREVHVRISSPPITHSCYFGIDTSTRKELIASDNNLEMIKEFIGADSLGYLSIEGLVKATGLSKQNLCLACFTGEYPIEIPREGRKYLFEKR